MCGPVTMLCIGREDGGPTEKLCSFLKGCEGMSSSGGGPLVPSGSGDLILLCCGPNDE